jgi:hypothetical protein
VSELPPDGRIAGWLSAVRGLTLTNAVVIVLLVAVMIPAYFVYRALGDPALLDRFLSSYTELPPAGTSCTIRQASMRGGPDVWSISRGFAFQGSDRWSVAVLLDRRPTDEDVTTYCATLGIIVDHMHAG